MTEFVAVMHRGIRAVAHVPDVPEVLAIHADAGWERVPEGVNLRDPDAVAALFHPKKTTSKEN